MRMGMGRRRKLVFPRPGADYVAPDKNNNNKLKKNPINEKEQA
jgi:hypothetical protein